MNKYLPGAPGDPLSPISPTPLSPFSPLTPGEPAVGKQEAISFRNQALNLVNN